jgi:hypothetical protein
MEESKARALAYARAKTRLARKYKDDMLILYTEELNRMQLKSREQQFTERYNES